MKVEFIEKNDEVWISKSWDDGRSGSIRKMTDEDKWRHKSEWLSFSGEREEPTPKKAMKKSTKKATKKA